MNIETIINAFGKDKPSSETDMIRLAYDYAKKAHEGKVRKNGEPSFNHSADTALTLAQMKTDVSTVMAGLLHDIPEDTEIGVEEIEKNFGKEIADIVRGVTKFSKIKYRGVERYAESLRKMFMAVSDDLRVMLIKFADRLDNLKTLDVHPLEKRRRIAQETLEIYVPVADLLGAWRLKWQMEDLCFKYLYPEEYKKLEYTYEIKRRQEREGLIENIKKILKKELEKQGVKADISARLKHLYSIWQKMQKKEREFNEIYDVFALRLVVDSVEDCYKTLGIIHTLWKPVPTRIKDYIALPKQNGYRSIHTTVFGPEKKLVEFQIRTKEMDGEAKYGFAAHSVYKSGSKDQPRWIKEVLEIQKNAADSNDFLNQLKFDIFQKRIFVFTPEGDVIDLPEGSTSIDFAYAIHTDVGNHATGVRINNVMATLDTVLKNGDVIEVQIDKKRKEPNQDWLKFAKTSRARSKIKSSTSKSFFNFKTPFSGK